MYTVNLPVKPLEKLYIIDGRGKEDGGYTPHVKEFLVCHYEVLADNIMAINEYGHRISLKLIGKIVFVKKEMAESKLKAIMQ